MAPKAKAKVKATKAKVKGKFAAKLKKKVITKKRPKKDNEADDDYEADVEESEEKEEAADEGKEENDEKEENEDEVSNAGSKAQAHKELMEKIREFKKKMKDAGPVNKEKVAQMMKVHFTKTQRSSLWQMGDKLILQNSSKQGNEAWQEMKAKGDTTHRKGKTEAKNHMLALCLAFGSKWENHMAAEVRSIVDSRKKRMLQLLLHFYFM